MDLAAPGVIVDPCDAAQHSERLRSTEAPGSAAITRVHGDGESEVLMTVYDENKNTLLFCTLLLGYPILTKYFLVTPHSTARVIRTTAQSPGPVFGCSLAAGVSGAMTFSFGAELTGVMS